MDYWKSYARWLSIQLVNASSSSSVPRDDDNARRLLRKRLVGEGAEPQKVNMNECRILEIDSNEHQRYQMAEVERIAQVRIMMLYSQ